MSEKTIVTTLKKLLNIIASTGSPANTSMTNHHVNQKLKQLKKRRKNKKTAYRYPSKR
ncbi:hypothetical protein [Listeria cornellensis]|uniref:hypothetical protein n=1 Tax=Listeria cornellensis TaxID=1494961 RepID=UPI0004BCC277|nr:hypothetical protein [Listeria cornellensis]